MGINGHNLKINVTCHCMRHKSLFTAGQEQEATSFVALKIYHSHVLSKYHINSFQNGRDKFPIRIKRTPKIKFVLLTCKLTLHTTVKLMLSDWSRGRWVQQQQSKRAVRAARGNAFTLKELSLATMATVRTLSACACTLGSA